MRGRTDEPLDRLAGDLDRWSSGGLDGAEAASLAASLVASAESLTGPGNVAAADRDLARRYLDVTADPAFLGRLEYPGMVGRWAETAFSFIRLTGYSLLDMFEDRVRAVGPHILFRDMSGPAFTEWSYSEVAGRVRQIAGVFHLMSGGREPRVALFSENHLDIACSDLACLFYGILVTPLNPHFSSDNLAMIFDKLGINIVVTDTPQRIEVLRETARKASGPFKVISVNRIPGGEPGPEFLGELVLGVSRREVDEVLGGLPKRDIGRVCTVMFTSGSTGVPKGVSFSAYNLVSKRFARAAALPEVGRDEVLLSFLPLYHTFGRYFELLGAIFWRGTYVFTGNPSAETVLSLFPKVNPTGFVSVPIRWLQLYEKCQDEISTPGREGDLAEAVRSVIGDRLRWGISAAGYLDPQVFRFFERFGVKLVAGFGMTEGTGGMTMTPPGGYVENTQGLPLPGVELKLGEGGELLARGHYIARYLDDKGPWEDIPYPEGPCSDYWLRTGDVFQVLSNGYYRIVDRIKDIYKNNRGQTVAPRKVEGRFDSVPGIKRAFLAGDGRPFNALLIVPDMEDSVLRESLVRENEREYYRTIINAANQDLAPYERVVNFILLDRDFDRDRGELTAKGTFNRKKIERNFRGVLDELYRKNYIDLRKDDLHVRVPLWLLRDLGLLEDGFKLEAGGLVDPARGLRLALGYEPDTRRWLVGDLAYEIKNAVIDLGLFARQPNLWCGNPALVSFLPCKEGWDTSHPGISERASLPMNRRVMPGDEDVPLPSGAKDQSLVRTHVILSRMLFSTFVDDALALANVERSFYESTDVRISTLIRHRLEAMARHPKEELRCWAYRLLILDEPRPGYNPPLPSFVDSGLSFLNEESIELIASTRLGGGRLNALRRRMADYRDTLSWPASEKTRDQFMRILRLFADFARLHPELVSGVAGELASWALLTQEPVLSRTAGDLLARVLAVHRANLAAAVTAKVDGRFVDNMFLEEGFSDEERSALIRALCDPTFLMESISVAYGREPFDLDDLPSSRVWVSRLKSGPGTLGCRVSVNMRKDEHFDLKVMIEGGSVDERTLTAKALWYLALSEHHDRAGLLPRFGAWRPDLKAFSCRFFGRLTAWERIREFAGRNSAALPVATPQEWRPLFVSAMSAFLRLLRAAGFRIVPGIPTPENVAVEHAESGDGGVVLSLEGRRPYSGPVSIIRPMIDGFYRKTVAAYPWAVKFIDPAWIFDACLEAWDADSARVFFDDLRRELEGGDIVLPDGGGLASALGEYLEDIKRNPIVPLPALNAVHRYKDWESDNPQSGREEKERKVLEFLDQHELDSRPEWVRFYVYRHTYFASLGAEVAEAFENLIRKMIQSPGKEAVHFLELSDLQTVMEDERDRRVFGRMVFPRLKTGAGFNISRSGESGREKVLVRSVIKDGKGAEFVFSEAWDPVEIGRLYRLFFKANYPMIISQEDRHYVVRDKGGEVVGGLSFRYMSRNAVFIDGIAVSENLQKNHLGRAMLNDFMARMENYGVKVVMTHYLLPAFFLKSGFVVDKRWGALIRYL